VPKRPKEIKEVYNTPEITVRMQVSSKIAREALREHQVMDKEILQHATVNRFQQVVWLLPAKELVKAC